MQRRLKERLIGAAVLVMLAVIFIPMLLDNSAQKESEITATNIPERPVSEFSSRVLPLQEPLPTAAPGMDIPAGEGSDADAVGLPAPGDPDTVVAEPVREAVIQPEESGPAAVPDSARPKPSDDEAGLRAFVVQLGSFSSEENARSLNDKARSLGFTSFVEPVRQDSGLAYRVRVGPELLRSDAMELAARLKDALGVDGIVMTYP